MLNWLAGEYKRWKNHVNQDSDAGRLSIGQRKTSTCTSGTITLHIV